MMLHLVCIRVKLRACKLLLLLFPCALVHPTFAPPLGLSWLAVFFLRPRALLLFSRAPF